MRTDGGAVVSLEVTRMATGRKNALRHRGLRQRRRPALRPRVAQPASTCASTAPTASPACSSPSPTTPTSTAGGRRGTCLGWDATFTNQAADLLAALAAGQEPTPSFEDGLAVQRVLAAIEASAAARRRSCPCATAGVEHLMSTTVHPVHRPVGRPAARGGRRLAAGWGYDGLEIAVSGEHLDVWRSGGRRLPRRRARAILERHGLQVHAISQPPRRPGRVRRPDRLPPPGDPAEPRVGRRRRRGRAPARRRRDEAAPRAPPRGSASTPSSASRARASGSTSRCSRPCPPSASTPATTTSPTAGTRSSTSSTSEGVRFAHEVHPSEIAYDYWTTPPRARRHRPPRGVRLQLGPRHMMWQGIDPVAFIADFADRIYHVDCKDTRMRPRHGRAGILGSHLPWGDPRRGWDFVSTGHGDVPWEDCVPRAHGDRLRPARSRSSGRTPAWTGCAVPPRRWCTCAPSTSTRRAVLRRRLQQAVGGLDSPP